MKPAHRISAVIALVALTGCGTINMSLPVRLQDGTVENASLKVNNRLLKSSIKSIEYDQGKLRVEGYSKTGDVEMIDAMRELVTSAVAAVPK